MSLIKPTNSGNPVRKRITIELNFEVWNRLLGTGEPRTILEGLIDSWYRAEVGKQETYIIDNTQRIKKLELGALSTSENLIVMRETLARTEAMGQHARANSLRAQIIEIERDLLLAEKLEKEKE